MSKSSQTLEEALSAAEEKVNEENKNVQEESTSQSNLQKGEEAIETTSKEKKETPVEVSPEKVQECRMFLDRFGIDEAKYSDQEVVEKVRRIQKARESHAQVLSRGRTLDGLDRLLKFVPDGYIGEFKRERPEDISRAHALGFRVFKSDEAAVASSTGSADGKVRLGDCILMIIPEEEYIAAHLAKQDNITHRRARRAPENQVGKPATGHGMQGVEADPLVPIVPM